MEDVRILVTGGGAPGAYGIISTLQKNSNFTVLSCDAKPNSLGSKLCEEHFILPMGDANDYIPSLLAKIKEHRISVLFPITTKELLPISKSIGEIQELGCTPIVSNVEALAIANDKGKLYAHLKSKGIAVPQFRVVKAVEEFEDALHMLDHPNKEVIFKPCVGNGSRGFRIVSKKINRHDLLFNHKPNATYISGEETLAILGEKDFPPLVVSEYMPGKEYTVDCLVRDGETRLIVPRLRSQMNNGISVKGTVEKNEDVIAYCASILDVLNLNGPIGIQVKYSVENEPLIVEINPRIQGTTVACMGAKINVAELAVLDQKNEQIEWQKVNENIKWNTHFIRHYNEFYF